MAYRVYLLERTQVGAAHIEVDTEDIDFSAVFSVADPTDLSIRKDKVTKEIAFRGTKTNNQAFGTLFHLNKNTDFNLSNRLFFNYNPLRTVDCLIYEDSELLMRGDMRVIEINVDKLGNVIYQTQVTGAFMGLRQILSEKLLETLDLSDLSHTYDYLRIKDSWASQTQRYNPSTNTFYNVPFAKGSGYVYPFIDYGETFRKNDYNSPRHRPFVHINNFRPAIYLKEYFDRIFSQSDLNGYSYEIKGEPELIDKFNSLIIPSNVEKLADRTTSRNFRLLKTTPAENIGIFSSANLFDSQKQYEYPISFHSGLVPGPLFHFNLVNYYGNYRSNTQCVFKVERNFTCDGMLNVVLNNIANNNFFPMRVGVELCERDWVENAHANGSHNSNFDKADSWKIVANTNVIVNGNSSIATKTFSLDIGEHKFLQGTQIMCRVRFYDSVFYVAQNLNQNSFQLASAELALAKDQATGIITYEVDYGDRVQPTAPVNVKQADFVKSIINLFNFYVSSDATRPKHLIFEPYDSYYARTAVSLLPSNAIDWTGKIDLNASLKIKGNLSLPKNYLFTYKSDNDYINKDYQDSFDKQVYGSFTFNDKFGILDQRKVELIFSPSPTVDYVGTDRIHPSIFVKDGTNIKPTKSNIRILFYNGMKTCAKFTISRDSMVNGAADKQDLETDINSYANACEFYFRNGVSNLTPVCSLAFNQPSRYYFGNVFPFMNAPGIYIDRYRNQVTELTNPNTLFVECNAWLDEGDIADIDNIMKTPVFIDLGPSADFGHAYFKVISVEYVNKDTPTKLTLQKIAV